MSSSSSSSSSSPSSSSSSSWLRTLLKIACLLFLVIVLLITAGVGYFLAAFPRVSPPARVEAPRTPERLARGQYLSLHVAGCVACHGQRDWARYSGPLLPDRLGQGGTAFKLDVGTIYSLNITPAGIGDWSDGELVRAITEGVSRDGHALFPIMPYDNYRTMAREDVEAIVAYVRTLPRIDQPPVPARALRFPLNLIVRTMPAPAVPSARPDPSDRVASGRYLATMASCVHCHTQRDDRGQMLPGMAFAGGLRFTLENGHVQHSANITPDRDTGIGLWSEADFVERFKGWERADDDALRAASRPNTDMPWRDFGGMTREDLASIYAYLRTVPPVRYAAPKP